ncbi:MAG: carbamoyltransferase HypF [Solirubrobacteraceae bacterium]
MTNARTRVRASVEGVVQGVGFRPFVHRLAREHELAGWVRNDARGALLEVEGEGAALERFLEALAERAPPLARIERVRTQPLRATGERGFRILHSSGRGAAGALVSADVAPCEECLTELLDPGDRRHRYPFINCTNCGPRFTIVRAVPYDRERTTMAAFAMCAACRAEYEDPAGRRFHAQPNACQACGPKARLIDGTGREMPAGDAVAAAAAMLAAGGIVAVKGAGGYHLACRADDERAVGELRRRKRREEKPFALMALDADALGGLVALAPAELALARGIERPIVIARRRPGAPVAESVAPRSPDLGVMLPSTPLHQLLLMDVGTALVMTSGNVSEEPIAFQDDDALARLGPLVDGLLVNDRAIHARADDSVVRSLGASARPLLLRRSRGHVPRSLQLPRPVAPLLACGAELKSTFCVAKGERAWVGPHVGDLRSWETLRSYREGIAHLQALFAVAPQVVVHDLHPDYLSTGYALACEDVELIAVQHHHAHLAAVLAEHGESGCAVGAIYDGAGFGGDGTVWGGELLAGGIAEARRVGHLQPVRLPGGDVAAREPWRMACSWVVAAGDGGARPAVRLARQVGRRRWEQVAAMARGGTSSPVTTSVGRLFDAVAALCGLRLSGREEGRAAADLEAVARLDERRSYPLPALAGEMVRLDARETVRAIVADLDAGASPALVSARFHNALAEATVDALTLLARRERVEVAVLGGGVFQNRLLLERCTAGLHASGLRVLVPRELPPNDAAISYGQAAVAAARIASRATASASAGTAAPTGPDSALPLSKLAPSTP